MQTTLRTAIVAAFMTLAGCASTTPTVETTPGYAIYDIKAPAGVTHAQIAEAVKTSLQKSMSAVQVTNSIPPSPMPEKSPRFQLVSPFKGSNLAALASASGQSLQVPTCEGAIMTAQAGDSSMRKYGEATSFFACVLPYQGGWSLNVYTTFRKASGAFNAQTLAATLMRPLTGDSSQSIPRTINGMVEAVKATGATVKLVEAFP
ncbi:MAG: hypothetical protein CFE45_43100 [Burkholderiales bacterium PBB5]|nr:MAG: hypothetical protein CFE45_43100 [Burkholderiales bacterium PBB5]